MISKRLPIAGFPHLFLSEQHDKEQRAKTISALREIGFKVDDSSVTPPEGASGRQVIAAISEAFQAARSA